MNAAVAEYRFGAVRSKSNGRLRTNRIAVAQGGPPPITVIFEQKNRRRLQLIEWEFAAGLSADEEAELEKLQRETAGIMEYLHPLPTDMLDALETLATRLESKANQNIP
jgi:hypothetical protein